MIDTASVCVCLRQMASTHQCSGGTWTNLLPEPNGQPSRTERTAFRNRKDSLPEPKGQPSRTESTAFRNRKDSLLEPKGQPSGTERTRLDQSVGSVLLSCCIRYSRYLPIAAFRNTPARLSGRDVVVVVVLRGGIERFLPTRRKCAWKG